VEALSLGGNLGDIRTLTTTTTYTIPVNAAGGRPKYIAVSTDTLAYIATGASGITAVSAVGTGRSMQVAAAAEPLILRVDGATHYAVVGASGTISVFPLENGGGAAAAAGTP